MNHHRRSWLLSSVWIVLLALALSLPALSAAAPPANAEAASFLEAINAKRKSSNLPALQTDATLQSLAQAHTDTAAPAGQIYPFDLASLPAGYDPKWTTRGTSKPGWNAKYMVDNNWNNLNDGINSATYSVVGIGVTKKQGTETYFWTVVMAKATTASAPAPTSTTGAAQQPTSTSAPAAAAPTKTPAPSGATPPAPTNTAAPAPTGAQPCGLPVVGVSASDATAFFNLASSAFVKQANNTWREGTVLSRRSDFSFIIKYFDDGSETPYIKLDGGKTIKSVDDALREGLTKNVYTLTCKGGKEQIVAAHNSERQAVGAAPLTWSDELAAKSQDWANRAVRREKGVGMGNMHSCSNCTENVAPQNFAYSAARASSGWAGEKKDYDLATKTCKPGAVCGHYTNMINPRLTKVGCGMARIPGKIVGNQITDHYEVWVCQYQ